jgi:hypothetical protein
MESPQSNSDNFLKRSESDSCERRLLHLQAIQAKNLYEFERIACADDVVYWLQNWGWTYDPRCSPAWVPFDPWPKQVEYLRWLEDREKGQEGGLVEKSRDAGVTWLCGAFSVHRWLFRDGISIGFGSRKEMYVDQADDPDSIFEKMRILIESLPPWMKPRGYDRKKHATFCKIVNPVNGNTITGEAGDNIGRGGRKSFYFVDEAAFIERAHLVERSLSATTNVRIDVSTPNGIGNVFYRKRVSGKVPVFVFDWRDDPRKTPEWAEAKKAELGLTGWEQEYGRNYSASVEGITIPAAWVQAAVDFPLPPDMGGPCRAGLDIAEEGKDLSVFITGRGPKVMDIVAWGQRTTTQTAYRAVEEARRLVAVTVNYDVVGVGTGPKGTWQAMPDKDKALWENGPIIQFVPINTGDSPTNARWPDGKTSKEKFDNLKAEAWWTLRARFERTYEHANGIKEHSPEDMISIPNDSQLIAELSIPKHEYTDKGKIKIESKKQLAARGVKSPDYAESLVLLFCPQPAKLKANIW